MVQHIGVGAGKIFGVRMIFARILPNLLEKLHEKWPTKMLFMLFWTPLGAIFAHIFRHLPRFSGILWRFSEIFAQISTDFSRIFTKSKLFVCTPASYTSGAT